MSLTAAISHGLAMYTHAAVEGCGCAHDPKEVKINIGVGVDVSSVTKNDTDFFQLIAIEMSTEHKKNKKNVSHHHQQQQIIIEIIIIFYLL
jgi:hypothetical protein